MYVPETFRDRPYAREHFSRIVAEARQNNPFYREWLRDPAYVPILSRATVLENNERIFQRAQQRTGVPGCPRRSPSKRRHSPLS